MHETGLLTDIERAFDAASVGDEIVHIPRLELALRVADVDEIGPALAAGIQRALTLHAFSRTLSSPVERNTSTRRVVPPFDELDALLHYLHLGLVPWPLANIGREPTLARLIQAATADPDRILAGVPRALPQAIAFLFRWLQLVASSEWGSIARRIELSVPDQVGAGLADAIAALGEVDLPELPNHDRLRLVAALLAIAIHARADSGAAGGSAPESPPWPIVSPAGDARPEIRDLAALVARLPSARWPPAAATWIAGHVPSSTVADQAHVRDTETSPPSESAAPALPSADRPAHRASRASMADGGTGSELATGEDKSPAPFGLAVDHAGLVLLHPFLPLLFERTGVVPASASHRSLSDDVVPRAAALLSFAARGDDDPFELELGLVKVLLGRRPDASILISSGLVGPADRREVDALLASVLEHWRALKHTSIAGLRTSFLQRRGLVAEIDGTWRLRVDTQPFDLLLDQLPWSISTVKLPWMHTPLFAEWTTP